jgi:hypothetical protein
VDGERQQVTAESAAEGDGAAAGQKLGQVEHRRNSNPPTDENRLAIGWWRLELIAEGPEDEDFVTCFEMRHPVGAGADDAVDDVEFDTLGRIAAAGEGEGTAEER